ncbi:MAG: flavodoxin family protein [Bacteroidales bacterium]|nr:flavodoxin family protein [Bacteroidales bacterium]MBN2821414.1 flavodoxin family protein [Bacteroidales bacterium]
MNSIKLYYFSGTGNSRKIAEWFSEVSAGKGLKTEICNISEIYRKNIEQPANEQFIGFCSPTHGFNFPPVMMNFIFRFPRAKYCNKVVLMNTRAGMKLYKLFLPGLSGIALLLACLFLFLKGYKIVALRSFDLPSNWISLHPGIRKKPVDSMFIRIEKITKKFAKQILDGKRNYKALLSLPFDLAVVPIAFLYYFFGRFVLAKTFFA